MARAKAMRRLADNRLASSMVCASAACLSVGVAWFDLLMRPRGASAAFGLICGHLGSSAPHCPACYAAAALIAIGVGLGAASLELSASATADA